MWWEIPLVTASVIAALTGVIGLLWKISSLIRRGEQLLAKDTDGKTSLDRVTDRLSLADERLNRIDYQLHPNGGGSLSDKVNKVEKDIVEVKAQNEVVLGLLNRIVEK